MRDLEASDTAGARLAIDYFVYRIACARPAPWPPPWAASTALVFTAGIGERSATIRARVVERLSWLGAELDQPPTASTRWSSRPPTSRLQALVVPTDEELMIARHALRLVRGADGPSQEEATV